MKNSSELQQLLLLNLFRKFLTERKYLMKTYLQVMMALNQNFINTLQMN